MTLQGLKQTVTGGVASTSMAVALMLGFSPAIAHADVYDDIGEQYAHGAGTGQVANLITQSLKLRSMGFKPSQANTAEVTKALDDRPNQTPLIHALNDTIAYQNRLKNEAQVGQGNNQFTIGVNQYDPNSPGGVTLGPGGVNIGGGAWQIGGQPGSVVGPPAP
ncbi:MAG: hypothetical protein JO152_13210 [Mycobacteriaceae bacterium]|nr:hypothetical protein [Mycobacteriaceae bacterium]